MDGLTFWSSIYVEHRMEHCIERNQTIFLKYICNARFLQYLCTEIRNCYTRGGPSWDGFTSKSLSIAAIVYMFYSIPSVINATMSIDR